MEVQEYCRSTGFVQCFSSGTGIYGSRITTVYSGKAIVQGYRDTGIVQVFIGTVVVQGYKGAGVRGDRVQV
jgi:hypothetical protein